MTRSNLHIEAERRESGNWDPASAQHIYGLHHLLALELWRMLKAGQLPDPIDPQTVLGCCGERGAGHRFVGMLQMEGSGT